jgi:rhamnosyltransferase
MKKVVASIIIRVKNEARWLSRCLGMIKSQTFNNYEIIIVDDNSIDDSIEIAKYFEVDHIIKIQDYTPGKALNEGAKLARGNYLVFISAHCVPYNNLWLQLLLEGFNQSTKIQGVYGRQIPLPNSDKSNSIDLLSIFRTESKTQKNDNFFHNANSAINYEAWKSNPFDEKINSLEDQQWAKRIITLGGEIFYNASATVYHHDGLHFDESNTRATNVLRSLKKLSAINLNGLPEYAKLQIGNICSLCVVDDVKNINQIDNMLDNYVNFLKKRSTFENRNILVCSENFYRDVSNKLPKNDLSSIIFLNRSEYHLKLNPKNDLLDILKSSYEIAGKTINDYPDAIFFYNPQYLPPSDETVNNLLHTYFSSDLDLVVLGKKVDGTTWIRSSDGYYQSIETQLEPDSSRLNVIQSHLGAGCIINTISIKGKSFLKSRNISILEVSAETTLARTVYEK